MPERPAVPLTPEQRRLVADNIGLAKKAAGRFQRRFPNLRDDLLGAAYVGLCRAAQLYDPAKTRFSTFGTIHAESACLRVLFKLRPKSYRHRWQVERYGPAPAVAHGSDFLDATAAGSPPPGSDLETRDQVERLLLPARKIDREILRLRFGEGATWREVADATGLDRATVAQRAAAALATCRQAAGIAAAPPDLTPDAPPKRRDAAPCAKCGTKRGRLVAGTFEPLRRDGRPYGFAGVLCGACSGYEGRRRRPPGPAKTTARPATFATATENP